MKDFRDMSKDNSPEYFKTQIESLKMELEELISRSDKLVVPQIISISQKLDDLILKYISTSHRK
ncbi:aspartyl-phosphate phosphatase Spo0E family protein [Caloramator sp. E03]|uniref:aspartyl-phosphate phosphatase Spo0E family protein n=1 Tax=Caloramator sp. E03 TaxID=2576307 RepID=UPI00143CCD32|nr:aspartyl-phosphate phosphatase Spo0E family protein [Caloramator sp. E03]